MRLLDTSAWVEYFKGSEKGQKVREFLENDSVVYTCSLTLAEIAKWLWENQQDPDITIAQIKKNSILIFPEEEILIESGKQYVELRKRNSGISLIDVIIYGTAQIHGLTLVTTDFDFSGLLEVEFL